MFKMIGAAGALLIALHAYTQPPERTTVIKRDKDMVREWKYSHPCPPACATYYRNARGEFVIHRKCGRCEADHICPLACGGPDSPENLQWLFDYQNRAKSDDCSECKR